MFITTYTRVDGTHGEVTTADEGEARHAFTRAVEAGATEAQCAWMGEDEHGDDDEILLSHPELDFVGL